MIKHDLILLKPIQFTNWMVEEQKNFLDVQLLHLLYSWTCLNRIQACQTNMSFRSMFQISVVILKQLEHDISFDSIRIIRSIFKEDKMNYSFLLQKFRSLTKFVYGLHGCKRFIMQRSSDGSGLMIKKCAEMPHTSSTINKYISIWTYEVWPISWTKPDVIANRYFAIGNRYFPIKISNRWWTDTTNTL